MRIFICGDIHRTHDVEKLQEFKRLMKDDLTEDDYLISCGDVAATWYGGYKDEAYIATELNTLPCTFLFVDGNHENFDALYKYPKSKWRGGEVRQLADKVFHLSRGQIFDFDGTKIFTFGGAKSIDRGYDLLPVAWWKEELPTAEEILLAEKNLKKHGNKVDYVITHEVSTELMKQMFHYPKPFGSHLSTFMGELMKKIEFKHWYFGHHHQDKTHDKYTCLYNTILELKLLEVEE